MEDVVLKDKHDLAINSLRLGFIDFDKGFYIIGDSDSEWLSKLNTSDGEPLTDAIDEREFWFEFYGESILEFYPIGKDMIYVVTENGPFIIDSDLEILDVLRKFKPAEYEKEDGEVNYDPIYMGNGELLRMTKYEGQEGHRLELESISLDGVKK